jgi:MraZ protein
MFLGRYRHTLDNKDRLTVPAKYREYLADDLYFVQGFDRNVMAMSTPTFQIITRRLEALSITDPDVRLLNRRILGSATLEAIDKNGRVHLPDFLREEVGLGRELVLVGQGEYFELWSPEEWAKQVAAQLDIEANNQRFKVLDLRLGSE